MQRSLRKKREFHDVSIEQLWKALTSGKQLENWFMENNFQGNENTAFEFLDNPGDKWKGVYYGEVISFQPVINLAYSWSHRKLNHTTYVWWKLEEKETGVILELEHSGFKGMSDYLRSFSYSNFWNRKLKKLLSYLQEQRDKVEI